MSVDAARHSAFCAFDDVVRKKAYSNLAIKSATENLDTRDKAFAGALFYGCLEKLLTLDFILEKHIKSRPKPVIKNILRFGAYQIYFMGSVPEHAAVKTSCELAKKIGKSASVGFINAVLRSAAKDKNDFSIPDNIDSIKKLSIEYSFPEWIIKMWISHLGKEKAYKLISYQKENMFTIYPNRQKSMNEDNLSKELKKANVKHVKSTFCEDMYHVNGDIFTLKLFDEGKIAVQGEASHLAAKCVVENKPNTVLDICAAPGGKTAAMANFKPDCSYTACDVHENRVEIMKKQFERLGVNAETFCIDATKDTGVLGLYDAVLVDAPCSALGTVFTHPEVRYTKSKEDIAGIIDVQNKILGNAAKHVARGGRLIYATCTINEDENKAVVSRFLSNNKQFKSVFPKTFYGIINDNRFDGCGVTLLPSEDGTAGFYIACMDKSNG